MSESPWALLWGNCQCGHTLDEHFFPDGGMEPCSVCDCETYEGDADE